MHAQGLCDARSEAVSLNQGPDQRANVIDARAIGEITKRLGARFSGARLEVEKMEFTAELGMRWAQILAYAHHGLIERQPRFHADHSQVQSVGKAKANPALAFLQLSFEHEPRYKKAECRHPHQQQGRRETGEQKNRQETKRREENAQTVVNARMLRAAISRLNQQSAGLGNIGRREWQSTAQRIETLLHAFADGRFCLRCWPLPANFAQAGTEHGRRRNYGRSKGEDDYADG